MDQPRQGITITGRLKNQTAETDHPRTSRMTSRRTRDLGQLMIITRPRYRNRRILIRHFVLTTLTWLMWLAMIYFISRDYRQIFSRPVLDGQTLPQLAKTVLLVILLQFNLLLSWSLITGSAMRKRMRRQRKNNEQNTSKAV